MPPDLQAKLLRVVQEGVVTPVGSGKEIPVDVRIISATHKPLESLIETGQFREDLFFRLNVIPITVASLRERPEEIVELFDPFSTAYALQGDPIKLNARSVSLLQAYHWPGNVRELENVIERQVITADGRLDLDLPGPDSTARLNTTTPPPRHYRCE